MASPSPINLALFTDSLEPSGVGEVISLLSRALPDHRYRQMLICPDHPAVDSLVGRCPGAAVVRRLTVRDDGELSQFAELVRLLQSERVDVFHNHIGATWEGDWGTLAARMAGVEAVVTTEHLPCLIDRPGERRFKRRVNCLADHVIAVSESVRQSHLRSEIVEEQQIVTIQNGIDVARFRSLQPPAAATELRQIPADALIGTIGRMTEQKGHIFLLRAIPQVLARYPEARFVWIGDGPERGCLAAEARRLGVLDNVWFMGSQPEAWRWLPVFDFTVLPSKFEGLPLAALESMAAGRAVVGAMTCGTRDAVRDGETGLLVEPCNPDALAAGILRLLDHPEACAEMGERASRRAEAEFSVQRMAREHDELYRRLLASSVSSTFIRGWNPIDGSRPGRHPAVAPSRSSGRIGNPRLQSFEAGAWRGPRLAAAAGIKEEKDEPDTD